MGHFSFLSFTERDAELAQAEVETLVGPARLAGRLAFTESGGDVSRAAHVNWCARELAAAATLPELCERLSDPPVGADDFRIVVVKPRSAKGLRSAELAGEVAARLEGRPNLDAPKVQFALALTDDAVRFGQIISQADKGWQAHTRRPCEYSNALPVRVARTMVNLVLQPGETMLDPCCGSGTLVIEAASIGAIASGSDVNASMVEAARRNLAHFGLSASVGVARAEEIAGRYDAVVTDLPYGRTSPADAELYRAILTNLALRAPRAAIVTAGHHSELLEGCGYEVLRVARHPKGSLTRHIHVCRSRRAEGGPSAAQEQA